MFCISQLSLDDGDSPPMRICSNDSAENQETDSKMCLVWNRKYFSGILACKCAVSVALSFFIWYSYFYYDCGCYGLVSWFQDFIIMGKIIIQISSYYFKRSWILTLLPTISDKYWIYNIDWVRRNIWAGYLHEVYPKTLVLRKQWASRILYKMVDSME